MKFGLVVFPGTTGQDDMMHVLVHVMRQEVDLLWHKDFDLSAFHTDDCIVFSGGSSYGDFLRPGALACLSPIMPAIRAFADAGGYLMGVGNGFQILCEAGLLPGALTINPSQRFIGKDIYLKTMTSHSPITAAISPDEVLCLPIAHTYGRYYTDASTLDTLHRQDQILFKYCSPTGEFTESSNPTASVQHIAGLCNQRRNVFGLMPHPERAAEAVLGNEDGRTLFESLIRTAKIDIKA